MSFRYEPLTEEEAEKARQFPLLEPGIYNFEVVKSEFQMSNTGKYKNPQKPSNPMIKLEMIVWDSSGKEFIVYDYLVGTKNMEWKTRNFCKSVGLFDQYENKKFNEDLCIGRSGKASIVVQPGQKKVIQPGQDKKEVTYYKDKNGIEDYIFDEKEEKNKEDESFDDNIPF